MRLDKGVHSTGIGLNTRAVICGDSLNGLPGGESHPQNSLLAIVLENIWANHFGQFSSGEAPHSVHLEQAVLGGDIALGEEQIVEIRRLDSGDAVIVAQNRYRGSE